MDSSLLAVLLSAVLGALGALFVPRIVASVPEPVPEPNAAEPEPNAAEAPATSSAEGPDEDVAAEEPKVLYADIARAPGLRGWAVLVGAGAGALIGWGVGWDPKLDAWLLALPVLLALSWIDWNTKLLPNHLMWPLIWAVTLVVPVTVWLSDSLSAAGGVLLQAAGAWVFYFVLCVIHPSGIGFGDVRLSWVLGLLLASAGLPELLAGLWFGFAIGGLAGVLLGGLRGVRKRQIPFGPFMVIGALVGLLCGQALLGGLAG